MLLVIERVSIKQLKLGLKKYWTNINNEWNRVNLKIVVVGGTRYCWI